MAKQTIAERRVKGLYWDRVWKINEGCTKVSPGCENCWSEAETAMRQHNPNEKISSRAKLVLDPVTDKFDDIHLRHDNIDLPLRVKKPSVFAVWNDLFHGDVPFEFIDKAYAVMALCPQHTFLVLTKRAETMSAYFATDEESFIERISDAAVRLGNWADPDGAFDTVADTEFPYPNVYHGVTVCNQDEADRNIRYLLQVPGKRFLSIEPLLGSIDLIKTVRRCMPGWMGHDPVPSRVLRECGIDQVLLGGESGKNARPMHPDWVRTIRDQCEAAGVPFMFKQWGEFLPVGQILLDHGKIHGASAVKPGRMKLHYGGTPEHAPKYAFEKNGIEFTSFDDGRLTFRVTKKKAGRTLDGKIHEELIWDKKENK